MTHVLLRADAVLRGRGWPPAGDSSTRSLLFLLFLAVSFGGLYGAAMGTYDGRPLQSLYSASKVPLLLGVTFALALPSFFVLNTLAGLREDFGQALAALLSTQAALAMVLAAFAPITGLWYASFEDYSSAIVFNGVIFAASSSSAHLLLRRLYRPLVARNSRHRAMLRLWLITYAFVGIQMGWVLRPFIGNPEAPVRFFRAGAWGNAYEVVLKLVWKTFSSNAGG